MRLINGMIRRDGEYPSFIKALAESMKKERLPISVNGLSGGGETAFLCTFAQDSVEVLGRRCCYILPSESRCRALIKELADDGIAAEFFPSREQNYYNLSASHSVEGERIATLSKLISGKCSCIVCTPDAFLSPTMPYSLLRQLTFTLKNGGECDLEAITAALVLMGYARLDSVEGEGQFSRRGGILDVWPYGTMPVRAEFFGDEIDRLGIFDVETQRVVENIDVLTILPCRELIMTGQARQSVIGAVKGRISALEASLKADGKKAKRSKAKASDGFDGFSDGDVEADGENAATVSPAEAISALKGELAALEAGLSANFLDKYYKLIYGAGGTLASALASVGGIAVVCELTSCNSRIEAKELEISQETERLASSGLLDMKNIAPIPSQAEFISTLEGLTTVFCDSFSCSYRGKIGGLFGFRCRSLTSYGERFELFAEELEAYLKKGTEVYVSCENRTSCENIAQRLFDMAVPSIIVNGDGKKDGENVENAGAGLGGDGNSAGTAGKSGAVGKSGTVVGVAGNVTGDGTVGGTVGDTAKNAGSVGKFGDTEGKSGNGKGIVKLVAGGSAVGFELFSAGFALLSLRSGDASASRGIRGVRKKPRYSPGKKLTSYAELSVGDIVVHESYGIGVFEGMTSMTSDGVKRDYITVRYAGTDKLFVPAEQLEHITKYIGAGADDGSVKLTKMGGGDWIKAKARAKGAVRDIAKELVKLYAERQRRAGIAFPPDDALQGEFEANFEYTETDGQLDAIRDIKADMEKPSPMDRLLCGDVGYGKTEVALRAAFKAVCAGYQVAVLVPTTILALQHFSTFVQRLRGFPVRCEMVSRFRTAKQISEILSKTETGEVDILIGTHRIISKDVKFKRLGLLIVDEEQRFGVTQKEKLKSLYPDVDCLTLSATPIPRTLNMAMSGIRDISLLDEAPGERVAVQTYVLEHDTVIIDEAIRRELDRGGQVFYLYNRVESIERCAARIAKRHPDARIAVAHGKNERAELESIWQGMVDREIDILVCTTIIETGIDVPNANTLIIEDADRLGLSQLHQLRGRVGRSARRAYAYFTYRQNKELSEIAEKRLAAIREYAEFGAGFRIALRDMELRGAGDLLGAEQHGHLDSVGYDLYIKLLSEAVLEEKGERKAEIADCAVDFSCDAYIPEKYVPSQSERMALYKRFAEISSRDDICDIGDELCDRYGDYGRAVDNLMAIAYARSLGRECGIAKISQYGDALRISLHTFNAELWSEVYESFKARLRLESGRGDMNIIFKIAKGDTGPEAAIELLEAVKRILQSKTA